MEESNLKVSSGHAGCLFIVAYRLAVFQLQREYFQYKDMTSLISPSVRNPLHV